eukprot:scaffold1400_cov137-Cylindrotheca_fusiformis.AAC.20
MLSVIEEFEEGLEDGTGEEVVVFDNNESEVSFQSSLFLRVGAVGCLLLIAFTHGSRPSTIIILKVNLLVLNGKPNTTLPIDDPGYILIIPPDCFITSETTSSV